MADVGTTYVLDTKAAEDALDALGRKDDLLRAGARQTGEALTNAFSQAAAAGQKHLTQLDAILAETRQSGAATQQFAGEVAGLVKEIRDVAAAQEASRRAAAAAADERRKATAAAKEAAKAEKKAAEEAAAAAEKNKSAVDKLFDKLAAKTPAGGLFGGALAGAFAATGGVLALGAVIDRVKQGLTDFAAITGVQATLKALTGSAAEGGREFAYIKGQAQALGLELIPTAKAYAGLFAAAKEANIPVAQTRAIFEGVTGAAKVLNLTADDTNGVLLALQQIASKGTVASEELRGQIGERLPGAFGLAAKSMGLTTSELNKQLAAGKVLSADFLPKFAAQLKATYGGATADAAQQVGSNLGRINTFFAQSSARLGAAFAPAIGALAQFVTATKTTAEAARDSSDAYFKQRDNLKALVPAVGGLLANYESLNTISGRSIGQQMELDKTIQALGKSVPGAVTEFDKYGKALAINGDAVRAFIKDQQNLTAYLNRQALKDNRTDLVRLVDEQDFLQKRLQLLNQTEKETGRRVLPKGATQGGQILYYTPEETAKIVATAGEQLGQIQADIDANLENRQRLRGKSPLLPTLDSPEDKKAIDGLIKKQEDLIKDLKLRQLNATNENAGNGADFLFGKGGLNKQLEVAEKELDRLRGKVDKSAAARESKLLAAEKALAEARAALQTKAAAAAIKEADDARTRSRLQFEEEIRQIELIKQKLIEREKAVRKAGGKGNNADGLIDGTQQQQLNLLTQKANEDRLERDFAAAKKVTDYTLSLRAESDDKERTLLLRRYEEDRKLAADNEEAKFLLKEKYLRDAADLEFRINKRNSEAETAFNRDNVSRAVGEVFGTGTGKSVIEAKREEKRLLLEIERKAAQDQINNAAYLEDRLKKGEIEAGLARIARVDNLLKEIEQEKAKHKAEDFAFKLVFGEQDSPELRRQFEDTAQQVVGVINNILSAQLAAANAQVNARQQNITDLQSQLSAEIQLNKDGAASNIQGILDQIQAEKAAKREALAESRKIAREQQLVNDLQAVSSISLAVANVIAGWSSIPLVGSILGSIAAAAMVASFIATKATAGKAARADAGAGFFKGGYTGGNDVREERGPVHGKEFVFDNQKTASLREALFEPIHQGRPQDIQWHKPQLQALLPDMALPGAMKAERAQQQIILQQQNLEPVRAELALVRAELAHIRGTNERMANEEMVVPTVDGYIKEDRNTGSMKRVRLQ